MPAKNLSLNQETLELLEKLAEQHNLDESKLVTEALKHFSECKGTDQTQAMKLILTKYDGHCLKCKDEQGQPTKIPQASWALYGKGVGLICMDCFVQRIGDKSEVAKYLKNRHLDRITKALTKEADRLAETIESYQPMEKITRLSEQQSKLNLLVEQYLRSKVGSPEEKQALDEVLKENETTKQLIRDSEMLLRDLLEMRRRKKKVQQDQIEA